MPITPLKLTKDWEQFIRDYISGSADDPTQTPEARRLRIKHLEANPEEWFAYYFDKYCEATPAPFHIKATKRILSHERWYEVRAWFRGAAKTARTMMELIYMAATGEVRNVLIVSNSADNAERILTPYRLFFENNERFRADYGDQRVEGLWTSTEFTIKIGCSFRSLGAGQSPRGTRNEQTRPDFILIDDIDTDEECRNTDRIKDKWRWIEEALLNTTDVSKKRRVLFNGNIIAKDCCVARAIEKADYADIINIRMVNLKKADPDNDMKYGKSSWPSKNSEQDIDYTLSKISLFAGAKEYFNNPVSEGDTFKAVTYGACPPLSKFPFLVAYADPATSNKDKKGASTKALVLVGAIAGKFYIIKSYLDSCSNSTFIDWFYDLRDWIAGKTTVYYYIENNSLQDPFFEQVFKPLFTESGKTKGHLSVVGDARKKPEKFFRIEGTLEPLNRLGNLILNAAETDNPNMQRLKDQFLAVSPKLPMAVDGVDAVEGGVHIIQNKITTLAGAITSIPPRKNPKRY